MVGERVSCSVYRLVVKLALNLVNELGTKSDFELVVC